MQPWAQTVVVGRARLGGIPVGVVSVETRTVELTIPADPANADSESKLIQQAGQVWFPDSAYKTAQAIQDFSHEELPLFIFANWRGFSGGMKDMYDQVVKFGSYIVDALREYTHPIFIYVPPYAELRGGSWVVVDPLINPDYMEMYADSLSRGGVLEAEGTVEIKFKVKDVEKCIRRLDKETKQLVEQISNPELSESDRAELDERLKKRESHLVPLYHSVAVMFADLHDTPGRMEEKGCVTQVIDWAESRHFFYWRLRRRLLEHKLKKKMKQFLPASSQAQMDSMLSRWFVETQGTINAYQYEDDKVSVDWLEKQVAGENTTVMENISCLQREHVLESVKGMMSNHPDIVMDSMVSMTQHMTPAQRIELSRILANLGSEDDAGKTNTTEQL
ncbi:acetyl-CoA carboxylase [Elysia marginata]|uniref:Acetyl-CoA carboxylase n=1 Tax=Elysia marginata TaxID=1093978 RepID=A0AAV4FQ84_9GAST|nr:acetyl-CoA carboxylase [Elysia marginata]